MHGVNVKKVQIWGKIMKKIALIILSIFLVSFLYGCSSNKTVSEKNSEKDEGPIKLGASLALTGGFGFVGEAMKQTFDFQVEQINAEGGINGRPLEMVYLDDENLPENAVKNANKLIQNEDVEIIIGPSVAATSEAIQNIIEQNKVVMYSLSGSYIGPPNSYAFSSSYSQETVHDVIHKWGKSEGITKIGMIATNDASGENSVNIVNALNGQDGIEYIIERMGPQDVDITPQLTRMSSKKIEALVVIGPGAAAGVAVKNATQIVPDLPVIATHSQLSDTFAQSIKSFIPEKMYITGTPVMAADKLSDSHPLKKNLQQFITEYSKKYDREPDFYSAIAYDTLSIIVEGLKKVGNDGPKLKEYFENYVKDFQGVHAMFNLTPNDHRGTSSEGIVLVRLNKDLSWDIAWDPYKN
jgi:branched-chain amino acid transport system substrate-binding protein